MFCLNLSAFTQNISLNLSNVTVKNAMEALKNEYGYSFVFESGDVDTQKRISVSAQKQPIDHVVKQILQGQELTYKIQNKNITISKALAQNRNANQKRKVISGTIYDPEKYPVIGANIIEKGTANGIVTDMNGNFSLEVAENATLLISYIGYTTQEVSVRNQTNINVILSEDHQTLNEVVVIGYGTVSKKELTSAVSHVSNKDFLNVGGNNPIMQIQGKVSGVSISNTASADPNSSTTIQVRGITSRQSTALGPLIVIDGVPGGNLNNINENDIESIDILKDGAASAIYGTRGSNGVVIVTTKKGSRDGTFSTTYTGYLNVYSPKKQLKVLSADEFRQHMPERGNDFGSNTDWFDELTQTGFTHFHTIQVSGGTARNNYRATVDYRDGKGIDIRSTRKEIGARMSVEHTGKSDLYKFIFNAAPRKIDSNNSDYAMFSQALTLNPTMPVRNPDNPKYFYEATGWEAENPVEKLSIEESGGTTKYLDWDATVRLNLLPLFAPDKNHTLTTQITLAQQINDTHNFWFRPSTSTLAMKSGHKGEANQERKRNIQESLEWLGNYAFTHNEHNLKAMAGYSYQYFQYTRLFAENKNFTSDKLLYNKLDDGTYNKEVIGRLGMASEKNDSKLIAFFGRLSYDYQGKYLATASLRYEGSSKFGANNKWGYFPAASVGWRISEESFMKDIYWINDLKIRGDYGVTGNQGFGNYESLATFGGYGEAYYGGKYYKGWSPNRNTNPNLKWEKGKNWNIGLDFSLFKHILSGSLNYFNRTQQDLLGSYNVPLPPHIATTTFVNVGSMRNQGFELDLNINAVQNNQFTYTIGLVGSTTHNKFLSFSNDIYTGQEYYWQDGFPAPGSPGAVQRIEEGKRVGTFHTFKYAGVDELGNWMVYNKDGEKIPIGDAVDEDKKDVGNGLPKYSLSMTNSFKYKNFDLTLFFRGYFGYQVYDIHNFYWGLQSAAPNLNVLQSTYKENAHITTGMNQHNSYFVKDADHLKLDVATLGYTLNVRNKWIDSFRIYFTGRNLFTITGYKGVDLDIFPSAGLQPGIPTDKKGYYPSSRQYLFGLQLSF
ncbi:MULTISPECIES: SusC/RagA family TonB-linked outer membrane protein [unclassified Parabacteroides]|nr:MULTISPECIES: SusC/RagA family TonB-linked outer membrane protein [unclassified Parabacteroides]